MTNYTWTTEHPFQALTLTGGGYRGLFSARALQVMEDHCGEPIGRHFDLIAGTSIGGIVALAVAFEIPMSTVVQTFEKRGSDIFPLTTHPPATSVQRWICGGMPEGHAIRLRSYGKASPRFFRLRPHCKMRFIR